jgi:TonB-linked SusC/RagA family outer membrane protein
MKLPTIILFAVCMQASVIVHAQRVTISCTNTPLEAVMKELQKQTDYSFIYTSELLKDAKPVTLNARNEPFSKLLQECFKNQPLTYTIVDKYIVIKRIPTPEIQSGTDTSANNRGTNLSPHVNISGRITATDGIPLSGANIKLKGTNHGTTTNQDGVFILSGVDGKAILEISHVGYLTTNFAVNNKNSITLSLQLNPAPLQEVIVRKGYYDEKKATTTGNVSTITAKEIEKQPVNNPLLALQGRIPGMEILQSTGMPGSGVMVQIRGRNSLTNGTDPLYIINGVPYTAQKPIDISAGVLGYSNATAGNPLSYINPADIESIDILKDADATAIYGSRGANGVVLITTKKGKPGKARVDVNLQTGIGQVSRRMKLLNTGQYLQMRREAFKNDGAIPDPDIDHDLTLWDSSRYTNWQKELIGGTAHYNDIQASVSGGNANIQYLMGSGYHKETTVFPGNFDANKASAHINVNILSDNSKFRIRFSGTYTSDNNHLISHDLTDEAIKLPPNAPALYQQDGSLNWQPNAAGVSSWPYNNPAAQLLHRFNTITNNLISNATLSYTVLPGLDIKTDAGYTTTRTDELVTIPLASFDPATWPTRQRNSRFGNINISSWIMEPQAVYSREFGKSSVQALIGTTIQQNKNHSVRLDASGFNNDMVMEDIKAATSIQVHTSINAQYKYNAVFGRLNYNWQDKYILNLTARRDGTSRFGPANQFQNFGAIGAGWIFSKEEKIQKNLGFLSYGKLRGSYGSTGSDQVGDYSFMDLYNYWNTAPYLGALGIYPDRIYTPDLAWEETRKLEVGLELGLWKDRVIFSGSFYRNRSTNQLVEYALPSITGFTSVRKNLDALIQNKGWEFDLRTVTVEISKFRWTSALNLTISRNKLLSGSNGLNAFYQRKIGHPLNSSFVYRFIEVDPITGLYTVADAHGNPTSNPNSATDANVLIDFTPRFYGGFQNNFSYKAVQLDFLFQFVDRPQAPLYQYNYIPGYYNSFPGGNQPATVLERWQNPGDVSPIQRFSQNSTTIQAFINERNSNHAYGNGSYIRLKNFSLSWQLPDAWKNRISLKNARVFIQAQNLLTITNYQGLDPETMSSVSLPPLRVMVMGMQLTF